MTGFAPGILSFGICDRCHLRYNYRQLKPDGNTPGLRVCAPCCDKIDPYRLPKRQPEAVVVQYPRPDVPLDGNPLGLMSDDNNVYVVTDDGGRWIRP